MNKNLQYPQRRSLRLPEYDYSQPGMYFLTTVTKDRKKIFGTIIDGNLQLSPIGLVVQKTWLELPHHFPFIELDEFCVMPDHFHGIIHILTEEELVYQHNPESLKYQPLSEIIRAFKSFSARRGNAILHQSGIPLWQRNYYEHIIEKDSELDRIREYIISNPLNWDKNEELY